MVAGDCIGDLKQIAASRLLRFLEPRHEDGDGGRSRWNVPRHLDVLLPPVPGHQTLDLARLGGAFTMLQHQHLRWQVFAEYEMGFLNECRRIRCDTLL